MSLPIISTDQRQAERRGIKGYIFGKSGVGKTALLRTLNAPTPLFLDHEADKIFPQGGDR